MANKRTTQLPLNTTPTNNDLLVIVNDGVTKKITVSGLTTLFLTTDTTITGGTYNNGTTTFVNNTGGTFTVSGYYTGFTGGVVGDLTATTISATTYYGLPTDVELTGGTYSSGTTVFTNNTGGTFSVSGYSNILWYAENSTPPSILPIASGPLSVAIGEGAEALGYNSMVIGSGAGSGSGNNYSNYIGGNAGYNSSISNHSNSIGTRAGSDTTNSSYSNFIGNNAGSGALISNDSNFIGTQAGSGTTGSYFSNFMGYQAGYGTTNGSYSNFMGYQAGSGAIDSNDSNFIGKQAGYGANDSPYSNFIGYYAGSGATNSPYSNFIGYYAGTGANNATFSFFVGDSAGAESAYSSNSNFIGNICGYQTTGTSFSNFIGYETGVNSIGTLNSNFIGSQAGAYLEGVSDSNFIGSNAGTGANNSRYSNFIGANAGDGATDSSYSNFIGVQAGYGTTDATFSTFIGYRAGYTFTDNNLGSNNIIIGNNISLPNGTTNSLNLGGVLFGTGTYSELSGEPLITPIPNGKIGIGIVAPRETLDVSGNTIISGDLTATTITATTLKTREIIVPTPTIISSNGEKVYFGSGTGLTAGLLYYYNSSGVWTVANSNVSASSTGMLGIALGSTIASGMLIRGYARYDVGNYTSASLGSVLYLGTTDGFFQTAAPSSSGQVVRVVGYCIDSTNDTIYFTPDNTWLQLI